MSQQQKYRSSSINKKEFVPNEDYPRNFEDRFFYHFTLDEDQKKFRDAIWDPNIKIVFCDAIAGAGKTQIAAATANLMYEYGRCDGIVYIAAPTQEQKQGYLAGSIEEKSAPYFEPFYQALLEIGVNPEAVTTSDITNQKNGTAYVSFITHTFLRGCNIKNKVVVIDEAQNYYVDELRKTLTRILDSCKVIVIGHTGQIDLYSHPERSGFAAYIRHYSGYEQAAICKLTKNYRGWISSTADRIEETLAVIKEEQREAREKQREIQGKTNAKPAAVPPPPQPQ